MATKRAKKQTLAEFRAWLAGVEELQPADWAPDATQWALIRDKINHVIEPKASTADSDMLQKLIESMGNGTTAGNNVAPRPPQGNPYAQAHIPTPPPVAGGIPEGPVEVAPAAAPYAAPAAAVPANTIDIESAAKPVDTGDGNYNSGFI